MNIKSRVGKNYIYNVLYQLLTIAIPLVTTPYISRVIGEKGIGAYSWVQSIIGTFLLISAFGVNVYGQREIACCQDDIYRRSKLLEELLLMKGVAIVPCLFIYFFLYRLSGRYPSLFLIQSIGFLSVFLDTSFFLKGIENFKDLMLKSAAVKILSTAAIFIFIKKPTDVPLYALCMEGSSLLGIFAVLVRVRRYVRYVPLRELDTYKHFRRSALYLLPEIAIHIYGVMDKTMLGILYSDIGENGFYTQGQKIIKVSLAVVTSMGTVMLPRMSNVFAHKEEEKIEKYLSATMRFAVFMGTGMTMGLCGIARGLVPWFFGKGFEPVVTILYLLGISILPVSISNVTGLQCLIPFGRQKEYNISVISGAICNLTINLMLIPRYGAVGACIGTIISEFLVMAVQWHFVRKMVRLEGIWKSIVLSMTAGTIMLLALLGLENVMQTGILATFAEILLGGILYILILAALKDVFANMIIETITGFAKTKIRKKK